MSSLEIRQIEPTWQNAVRVAELTREVYQNAGFYEPSDLDSIANPSDDTAVARVLGRLQTQDTEPLQQHYYGLHGTDGRVEGYLKAAVWDDEDQEPFSGEANNPTEYYSVRNEVENRVFGAHVIAIAHTVQGSGYGRLLFDRMTQDYPNSVIKTAVDERDTYLKEYMQRAWGMEDTKQVGAVALGATDLAPLHRLFKAKINPTGSAER